MCSKFDAYNSSWSITNRQWIETYETIKGALKSFAVVIGWITLRIEGKTKSVMLPITIWKLLINLISWAHSFIFNSIQSNGVEKKKLFYHCCHVNCSVCLLCFFISIQQSHRITSFFSATDLDHCDDFVSHKLYEILVDIAVLKTTITSSCHSWCCYFSQTKHIIHTKPFHRSFYSNVWGFFSTNSTLLKLFFMEVFLFEHFQHAKQ